MFFVDRFKNLRRRLFKPGSRVGVLRLVGPIGVRAGGIGGGAVINHAALAEEIDRAFETPKLTALALSINSPGGSPTQSALIAHHIRRKADEKGVKVYAFCEDIAASGGYFLASAADEIWADEYSIVGSIGAIMAGFGFQDLMERVGVERRVYAAGASKSMLDPFKPEKPEDVARVRRLLDGIHAGFIEEVKRRRGARLDLSAPGLFEGEVWLAPEALKIGLIDGIGHMEPILTEKLGGEPRFILMNPERRGFLARRFGLEATQGALAALEERAGPGLR